MAKEFLGKEFFYETLKDQYTVRKCTNPYKRKYSESLISSYGVQGRDKDLESSTFFNHRI